MAKLVTRAKSAVAPSIPRPSNGYAEIKYISLFYQCYCIPRQLPASPDISLQIYVVRIHDLRHSFASRALALGESLTMIGKLLGHTKIQTTARYAHLARDSIKLSAARVAASIGADILPAGRQAEC